MCLPISEPSPEKTITLEPTDTAEPIPSFEDSRRLTGHNRFFAGSGVVLTPLGPRAGDAVAHAGWRERVVALFHLLGWPAAAPIVRRHAGGTLLTFAAPADTLFTATEINEWAWEMASGYFAAGADRLGFDPLHPLGDHLAGVAAAFAVRANAERNQHLKALLANAAERAIPALVDDHDLSLGAGTGSRSWPLAMLPAVDEVAWPTLHTIPVCLVTGSNGKTTTVRLLAAMIEASAERYRGKVGYSCTEGISIGGESIEAGDYSGPAGARQVLRDPRVAAAVLETARGGILRRGLAVEHADVAIVTNISADHFGEYGIDSLDDLADVKLAVAHALGTAGTLVLNADDPVLLARAAARRCPVALFACDDNHPALIAHRKAGGATCGLTAGECWLSQDGRRTSLGRSGTMPLTLGGAATYNVANIAAAALGAAALGIKPAVIAEVLQRFGARREDNPGRLERWALADIRVLIDYAHNPDGLAQLLAVSRSLPVAAGSQAIASRAAASPAGRLGLVLGQAGNRGDAAIAELAHTAATARPDCIVIKEIAGMLRGRAPGEVPALIAAALQGAGYPMAQVRHEADEVDACRRLLEWAQAGDVLVLPVHQTASRRELAALLDALEQAAWRAGSPLPPRTAIAD